MNMPRTGFSKRDMLVRQLENLGRFRKLSKSVEEAHEAGQIKTTNRDVSVFVVMVKAFLRASLARHDESVRLNGQGWWGGAYSQP
jgi:hypothetical protein